MVKQQVTNQGGLAGTSSTYENAHGILWNHLHVKLPDAYVQCIALIRHFFVIRKQENTNGAVTSIYGNPMEALEWMHV